MHTSIFAKKEAFTIIEFLLVISIIIIVGTYSAQFFSNFISQNSVLNTQNMLVGQMRKAQMYSMMGKQNSSWGVAYSANTITLFKGASFAARDTAFDELSSVNANISIGGFTEVAFAKVTGVPSVSPLNATVSANNTTKNITMNGYGVISK